MQDYEKVFEMFRGKRIIYLNRNLITTRKHEMQTTNTYKNRIKEERWLYEAMLTQLKDSDFVGCGLDKYTVFCYMCEK